MNQLKGATKITGAIMTPTVQLIGDSSEISTDSSGAKMLGRVNPVLNLTGIIKDGINYGEVLLNVRYEDNKTIIWLTVNGEKVEPEVVVSDNYLTSIVLKEDSAGFYLLSSMKNGVKLKTPIEFSAKQIVYENNELGVTNVEEGLNRLSILSRDTRERLSLLENTALDKNLSTLPKADRDYSNTDSLVYIYQGDKPTYMNVQDLLSKILSTSDVNPSELQEYEYEFRRI